MGVVGAGTMGAGIAQLGCLAGIDTFLHDPLPDALERGATGLAQALQRGAERGRWDADAAQSAAGRLRVADTLEDLAQCELVVEAAPERLELKQELFARLSSICGPETVLATNTSSILVSSLATAAQHPENVVGMHFFNPAPAMRLLEVIAADQSGERALEVARAAGRAMGKQVIDAVDGPGFLVNRCGRPFGGEALRLLQERVATPEQIDRVCRLGGGFRMGPFELMDLVGIDVGFEVARSFEAQSFGEHRWKPNPLQARMVAAGRLGRKTGRGWYDYAGGAHRPEDPAPLGVGGGDGMRVCVTGEGPVAVELRALAARAGFDARDLDGFRGDGPELFVDAEVAASGDQLSVGLPEDVPVLVLCAGHSLASSAPYGCGFHLLPPLESAALVELTRLPTTAATTVEAAERFFGALGLHREWVGDAPGLVLGRIVCQLVNEAAFALGEGVGSAEDLDLGLELGLNHPRGPVAWGEAIGLEHVLATIDGLWDERREERYRAAPLLRRAVATGTGLR